MKKSRLKRYLPIKIEGTNTRVSHPMQTRSKCGIFEQKTRTCFTSVPIGNQLAEGLTKSLSKGKTDTILFERVS